MKFEFPAITVNNLFKFQAQDSDLEYLFWRFDEHIALSEKKLPLANLSFSGSKIARRGLSNQFFDQSHKVL